MTNTVIKYIDGNWDEVQDEAKAAWRLVITLDEAGNEIMRQRQSVGARVGRKTWSTDPRAKAVMKDGVHGGTPMSNPHGH
ncbi:MAG: hypothetical protein KY455_13045 [Euryarchaeota archaeon]|nr:hypothetical protein [Euryarchaeota archaeon]